MAKIRSAFAILLLPDGRVVLQRRTDRAPTSPGLLSLYGGRVNLNEHHLHAIKREISEETSLDPEKLKFELVTEYEVAHEETQGRKDNQIFIYKTDVPNFEFSIHEGKRLEVYSLKEALKRRDLTTIAREGLTIAANG